MNSGELIQQFYTELKTVEGLSENGSKTYIQSVKLFLEWLENEKIPLSAVSTRELIFYFAKRKNGSNEVLKIDERTVAKDISALRKFGSFLVENNFWKENFALLLQEPVKNQKLPKVLTVDEVETLLNAIDCTNPVGKRDRAFFELVYSSGLRISEACNLKMKNLHLKERILIVEGKGSKERMVPFGERAKNLLKIYLDEVRPNFVLNNRIIEEVFVNYKGEGISRKGIWKNFQKYEKLSGISAKVHTLRHSFATHLLAGGMDLVSVQELLGHSDLATTTIYTHIEQKQLQEEHKKYFPGHKNS